MTELETTALMVAADQQRGMQPDKSKDELLSYYAGFRQGTAYFPEELLKCRPRAYAAFVEGNCLCPVFKDGDLVLVDPDEKPAPNDFVVLGRHGWQSHAARLVELGGAGPLLKDGHHSAPYRALGETILGVIVCAIRPEAESA